MTDEKIKWFCSCWLGEALVLIMYLFHPESWLLFTGILGAILSAWIGYHFIYKSMKSWNKNLERIVRNSSWEDFLDEQLWASEVVKGYITEILEGLIEQNIQKEATEVYDKHAQLIALQSQINPHFLYNTLDTIVWLVEGGMQQDAVDMITSLSVFFRTSLSKGKDIIPLSEEKRHTLSYLEIQQSRYRDIMEFEINIPPELDEVMVPKLTLQPLAENALYHGIKNKRGKGKILIEGFNLGDDMMLRVTDNGQGMTPERLYEVQEAIRTGERAGFGLAAVSERIALYYGPGYGLKISSTEGEGTVMEVYMAKKINLDNNSRTVLWPADRDLRRSAK